MAGIITPRSGISNFSNIRFYNYPEGSIAFVTCSKCDDKKLFTNVGTEILLSKIKFSSVVGNYLFMLGLKRDIIYDLDASLSSTYDGLARTSATLVWNYPHITLYNQDACSLASNSTKWGGAIMCSQAVTIRRVMFTNLADPYIFNAKRLKAIQIDNFEEVVDPTIDNTLYSEITSFFDNLEPKL